MMQRLILIYLWMIVSFLQCFRYGLILTTVKSLQELYDNRSWLSETGEQIQIIDHTADNLWNFVELKTTKTPTIALQGIC